jgi:peptide/nickel transport system permease protein
MARFIAKRVGALVIMLLVLTAVMFVLQKLSHINLAVAYLGRNASPAQLARVRHQLGYDGSLPSQYLHYLDDVLHGNLETSLSSHRPVRDDIGQYLPPTLELMFFALGFALFGGLALGTISALRWRGSGILRVLMVSGAAAPSFLLALLGVILFYHRLGWLPATGQSSLSSSPTGPTHFLVLDCIIHGNMPALLDALRHLILPSLCLAIGPSVAIGRTLRGSLIATLRSDHIRTARAKGLKERAVVLRHGLRNASNAAAQMTGLQIGFMFAGVVVVEQTFAWPGIGNYTAEAIGNSDFPAIIGVSLVAGALFVILNAAVDIFQAAADPRIALQ